jgi:hypothetical protein
MAKLRVWTDRGRRASCSEGRGYDSSTYSRNYMGPALDVPVGAHRVLGTSGVGPDPSHELSDLVVNGTLVAHLAANLFPTM